MKKLLPLFGVIALALVLSAVVSEWRRQAPPETAEPDRQSPYRPPRVFGQTWLSDEADAWNEFRSVRSSPEQTIESGNRFLERYPSSGMSSFVHRDVALAYYRTGNEQGFVDHAEEALLELGQDVVTLSTLARVYAERGETETAEQRVREGRDALLASEKPLGFPLEVWTTQANRAKADLAFADAIVLLDRDAGIPASVELLESAIDLDPSFDVAYLALGTAHTRLGENDQAIASYARAAAIDGAASDSALEELERIYALAGEDDETLEEVIRRHEGYVQQKEAEHQAQVRQLMERILPTSARPQDCPTWDDIVTEESVTRIELGGRRLSMSFIYVNPEQLGACVLDEEQYRASRGDLFIKPGSHLFWIGLGGDSPGDFDTRSLYMIQGNSRFDVTSSAAIGAERAFPGIQSAAIISLEGEIDFSEPVTIFYTNGAVAYSNEYWLPERYLP